jgi:galactonate dehydratase
VKITGLYTAIIRSVGPSVFVKVTTDEGIIGLGECYPSAPASAVAAMIAHIGESLVGENPLDVDRLWEEVRRRYLFLGGQAGTLITALSGVEIALWDIAGKALGVPVYRLLGGAFRHRIRVYADLHAGAEPTPQSYAARARMAVDRGFTAIKFDVDDAAHPHKRDRWNGTATAAELATIVDRVAAVREEIGPTVDLAIDMHGQFDAPSGIQIARALAPFNLMWLEEPVPPENIAALREVKALGVVPICAGENLYTRFGFRELITTQAADIIMPDIPKCGGLSEARKIAALAELYYIPFAPHNVSSPVGTIAACHVCATIPNFLVLEWHAIDHPHWESLVQGAGPIIHDGYIYLSDAPGLGVELDDEVARRHLHTRMGDTYFA